MTPIRVIMLGRFDILAEGKSTVSFFGHSPKGILLLKYLLLNREREIPTAELIDALWPEPDKGNPENALKTLVSRLRASLAEASPYLENCIVSEPRAYRWNNDIAYTIDVVEFEQLCRLVNGQATLDATARERYAQILDLYKGDLSDSMVEDWLATRSMYLHHLYMAAAYRYIGLLVKEGDYDMAGEVCHTALNIDPYDERLNADLIRIYDAQGHRGAALKQYRFITDAHSKYLGVEPSRMILDLYEPLIRTANQNEVDIDSIREELREPGGQDGAFVCDYAIFRDIYHFHRRNKERSDSKMYLALATVEPGGNGKVPQADLNPVMEDLLQILTASLRRGDTLTRYSPNQFALLLPMTSVENGALITDRIRERFYALHPSSQYELKFQFGPATIL